LGRQLAEKTKQLDEIQNRKVMETMKYEVRRKGRVRAKEQLDAEFRDISSVLQKELSKQMNVGLDPKHIRMLGQLAINRVEKGFKTIEQVVDDIHQAIGGVIDKRQIRDVISGYGRVAKLSKDEINIDFREVKRQGRLVSAIEDALKGKSPLHSGLQRDPDSPIVTDLKKQLRAAMIKEGFSIDAERLSEQWSGLKESGSGKKLFASPEDQMMGLLEKYRKHLEKRESDLKKKLNDNEYRNNPKLKLKLDKQLQETKDRVDRLAEENKNRFSKQYDTLNEILTKKQIAIDMAKENKQLAEEYANLNESSIKKSFPADKEPISPEAIIERFKRHLEKRENDLQHKLISGDYETNTKTKTPLDAKVQAQKDHVDRLAKEYRNLKELRAKRANNISNREAVKIVELSKSVSKNKENVTDWNDRSPDGPALTYGRSLADFYDYSNNLKLQAEKRTVREALGAAMEHPLKETKGAIIKAGNVSKSILSSMDNSALGRQGMKIFWNELLQKRNPLSSENIWLKNAKQSFRDIVHEFGGENVMREIRADVMSRPNALNGRYKQAKIDLGNMEESFPTTLPERIPYLRKPYKASEVAFTGFQYRSRADLADRFFKMAEDMGIKLDEVDPITKKPKQLQSIGMFVNGLTGRGHLGEKLEASASTLNSVFFSPRFFKSNWDFLTMQMMNGPSPFVRKQAALSLTKYIAGTAVTLAIAQAFGAKIEKDPRSADFGKIRVGNTRFDITGGVAPLFTFATRMSVAAGSTFSNLFIKHAPWKATKSSTTGKIEPLTNVRGVAQTGLDMFVNQVAGKLGPVANLIKSLITGTDANRKELTLGSVIWNATMPIGIQSIKQTLEARDAASLLAVLPAEFFGIGANTYGEALPKKYKPLDNGKATGGLNYDEFFK
jgi:hypothetical protein